MGLSKTDAEKIAKGIVCTLGTDANSFGDHRRNDDCVDFCIACWILGKNPMDEVVKQVPRLEKSKRINGSDWLRTRNKIEVVSGYRDKWCPEGKEERGLNYLCRGISYYQN